MSEKSRYVTKASLRHITANDEASSLSGDFIIAHHSPAKVLTIKKKKFYICSDGTHTHAHKYNIMSYIYIYVYRYTHTRTHTEIYTYMRTHTYIMYSTYLDPAKGITTLWAPGLVLLTDANSPTPRWVAPGKRAAVWLLLLGPTDME